MNRSLLLMGAATVAVALALSACGQGETPAETDMAATTADDGGIMADADAMPDTTTAEGYVTAAAMSDLYEIEAGRLAQERGSSDQVRELGEMLVADHTASTERLTRAASQSDGVAAPTPRLDERHQGLINNLRNAEEADFDRVFLEQQVTMHQQALQLHQQWADNEQYPQLAAAAAEIAPVVERHLEAVRERLSAMGGDMDGGRTGEAMTGTEG